MRMSVENLNAIRDWAIRNQAAMPDATLRLVFATDLAKSVIEQVAAGSRPGGDCYLAITPTTQPPANR